MEVIGWILWAIVALYALGTFFNRNSDPGVRSMMRIQGFVLLIGLAVTALTNVSKLHLVWVTVLAFFIPMVVMQSKTKKGTKDFEDLVRESKETGKPLHELINNKLDKK